ncbi:MAG: trimeric intracellular cation channel family protein [Boseongicola sp.]|nr:MAG: trimeric intracellular cation channel family protein [Boseongicola sp.]
MTAGVFLDAASVFIFALTGALAASRAQLDIVGFLFFAALTAVGGGTVRDLLLDRHPVFWMDQPQVLGIAAIAAVSVFFTAHLVESRANWLTWLDAVALSIAVPAGLAAAVASGQTGIIAPIMGVLTGTLGGLMRDVVANEVPMVLRRGELYVTAAFLGAVAGWFAGTFGDALLAALVAAVVTFSLRAGSLIFGWKLPVYRSRPPR